MAVVGAGVGDRNKRAAIFGQHAIGKAARRVGDTPTTTSNNCSFLTESRSTETALFEPP